MNGVLKKMNKGDLNKILKNISNYLDSISYYQVNYSRYQVCNNFIDYLSDNNMLTDEEFLMIKSIVKNETEQSFSANEIIFYRFLEGKLNELLR